MDAPILRLYGDHWTSISFFLDAASVKNLLCAGSPRIVSILQRSVRNLTLGGLLAIMDYNRFFCFCSRFSAIESVAVELENLFSRAKVIQSPLQVPNTLTALAIKLSDVTLDFMAPNVDLAAIAPRLKSLSLEGSALSPSRSLGSYSLPSSLQSLKLSNTSQGFDIAKGDIDALPRGLTSLALPVDVWPEFDHYEWPHSLTTLTLDRLDNTKVLLESLPRTLREFVSSGQVEWCTRYQAAEGEIHYNERVNFPWRDFFPHLQVFEMYPVTTLGTSNLLRTFLKSDPLDYKAIQTFISSSYWDLASLRSNTPVTTTYSRLWIPNTFLKNHSDKELDHLERELQELAPLLENTNFWTYPDLPTSMLKYVPAAKSMMLSEDTKETDQLSPGLQNIYGIPHTLHLSIIPSGVRDISCNGFFLNTTEGDSKEASTASMKFPPHLTKLYISPPSIQLSLLSNLPTCLTDVTLSLRKPEEWNLIAERLVCLNQLVVTFNDWVCPNDAKLSRIASKYPLYLSFKNQAAAAPPTQEPLSRPILAEFFGDDADLDVSFTSSPLPQSLTHLNIDSPKLGVHPSIIPRLPRSLQGLHLSLDHSSMPYALPPGPVLSPTELLQFLPPRLRQLTMHLDKPTDETKFAVEGYALLPRGLVDLSTQAFQHPHSTWENRLEINAQIIKLLPPNMCRLDGGEDDLRHQYFKDKNLSNPA